MIELLSARNDPGVQSAKAEAPRILILGGGPVTSEYHVPSLYALGLAEKALVTDFADSILASLRARYPGLAVRKADYREVLGDPEVAQHHDAVIVALPNWLHEDACRRALNQGLHVLCEKPLALDAGACERLGADAERAGRVLAVGMVRRSLPSICALREALVRNLIGDLSSVNFEDGAPYAWLSDSGSFFRPENGGVLADMGVHYLDMLQWLLGPLTPVRYSDDWAGGVEANALYELHTPSGVPVRLSLSRTHALGNKATFTGAIGTLTVDKNREDACFWASRDGKLTAELTPTEPFSNRRWAPTFESCFNQQLARFLASIGGRGTTEVTALEAGSVSGLIDWAYRERRTNPVPKVAISHRRPSVAPGPVVVTGGTGFIGTRLVERLNEMGFNSIQVPVRGYRNCPSVARFAVNLPRLDLLDTPSVHQCLSGAKYVFHLAYGRDGEGAACVTVEGTRNVVEAAIKAGAECVVVLSTMYVFGGSQDRNPADESAPYAPRGGEYGRSKAEMERWCLRRDATSGKTRIVVLNPSCVYGPGGKTYTLLPAELARGGGFCWVDGGSGMANHVFVDNLVDAIVLAAGCEAARGQRFIINDGAATWRDFLGPIVSAANTDIPSYTSEELQSFDRKPLFPNVVRIAKVALRHADVRQEFKASRLFGSVLFTGRKVAPSVISRVRSGTNPPPREPGAATTTARPPSWLANLFGPETAVFTSAKARRTLGWSPGVNLREGQEASLGWLRETGIL